MSIQIDNGDFTRIHNEILGQLATARFTALEFRCLLFLIRMTYGWQKKEDVISLSQWAEGIGIDTKNRGNVLTTLNGLVSQGVIYMRSNGNNRPATWGLIKAYFEKPTVMQPHNSLCDESEQTVMQPHNTTVMQPHNSLTETVMQPHNHKRKERKKVLKKEESATQPPTIEAIPEPLPEKTITPQQEMFGAVCEALGWDYTILSKEDQGQVAQFCGILKKNNYTVDDIRRFITEFWFKDWRWEKSQKPPTMKILRQEIGIVRSVMPSAAPPQKAKGINSLNRLAASIGART